MRRRTVLGIGILLVLGGLLAGCTWFGAESLNLPQSIDTPGRAYILAFHRLSPGVAGEIEALGGTVLRVLDEIDAVLVTASPDELAAIEGLSGFSAAIPDLTVDWLPDLRKTELSADHIGDDEGFFENYQWDMKAIDAPGAWDAGYTGDGVRVAVLDTGIDVLHPDLVPNLNVALSASFVDTEPFIDDLDGHGTNVAGIIAAADNGVGVIGVAPNAEIVAVKVLGGDGSGNFGWMLEGILHAVSVDADVINLSLGTYMTHDGYVISGGEPIYVGASVIADFVNLVRKTIDYAIQQGVLVVASAGNDALNGTGDAGRMHVPSDVGGTVCVSATGPFGWGTDKTVYLDDVAVYTDYGPQVDFAAPGGNFDPTLPLYWHDFVLNCTNGQWYAWYAGTSQAAPHVAGVAALIIEANGGAMTPAHIERELRLSADDLGKPGQDIYYGSGRVNAAEAVK